MVVVIWWWWDDDDGGGGDGDITTKQSCNLPLDLYYTTKGGASMRGEGQLCMTYMGSR